MTVWVFIAAGLTAYAFIALFACSACAWLAADGDR
jgi:hypothetical protein